MRVTLLWPKGRFGMRCTVILGSGVELAALYSLRPQTAVTGWPSSAKWRAKSVRSWLVGAEEGWKNWLRRSMDQTSANAVRFSLTFSFSDFSRKYGPIARTSILVRRKQSMACAGVFTIGSFSLNDVFNSTGTPVTSPKRRINFQ